MPGPVNCCFFVSTVCGRLLASSSFPASPRPSGEADVCLYVAGSTAAQRDAVRQAGGLHHFGSRDGPRAAQSYPEGSAHPGPESKGEGLVSAVNVSCQWKLR